MSTRRAFLLQVTGIVVIGASRHRAFALGQRSADLASRIPIRVPV
jgi:hypothetical protein